MNGIDRLIGRKDNISNKDDSMVKVYYKSDGYETVGGDHLRSWIKDELGSYRLINKDDFLRRIDLNIANDLYQLGKGDNIKINRSTYKSLKELGYNEEDGEE